MSSKLLDTLEEGVQSEICTSSSLSEKEAARAELFSQKSVDPLRVVANLTHELKTPLHAILSTASILQSEIDGSLTDEQKKQVGIVKRNGEHLLEMITSLLHYSSTLTSTRNIFIQKIEMSSFLTEIFQEVYPVSISKKIEMRLIEEIRFYEILSDRDLIARIVTNILSNALKFTKEGGSVEMYTQKDQAGTVKIIIADTGVGMSPETKDKIFSAFYQADSSSTREFGGVGLGLSLVANACAQIKAHIKVESELGSGSIFTIEIPDLRHTVVKNSVLFISEDSTLIQSLQLIVEAEYHNFSCCGFSQLSTLSIQTPDLILCDDYNVDSPYELHTQLTKICTTGIPCLLSLFNSRDDSRKSAFIDAGFKDIIYKPFDAKEIKAKIHSFLKYKTI